MAKVAAGGEGVVQPLEKVTKGQESLVVRLQDLEIQALAGRRRLSDAAVNRAGQYRSRASSVCLRRSIGH